MIRSTADSGSGIMVGSANAVQERPLGGQFTTPWLVGMNAMVRSAMQWTGPRYGIA